MPRQKKQKKVETDEVFEFEKILDHRYERDGTVSHHFDTVFSFILEFLLNKISCSTVGVFRQVEKLSEL